MVHLRFDPSFPLFRTCDCFLHALTFFIHFLHNLRIACSVLFGNDALRFDILCFLDTEISHDLLFFLFATAKALKRIMTCVVVSSNVSLFSACSFGRIEPQLQKYFSFCIVLFTHFAPGHLVDDDGLCDVNCFVVHCTAPLCVCLPSYLFLDTGTTLCQFMFVLEIAT